VPTERGKWDMSEGAGAARSGADDGARARAH
jgi:hypothetical protein